MSYGIPSRIEAEQIRARINAARQKAERTESHKEYVAARAEARACGYEFPTFAEWIGGYSPKDAALDHYMNESDDYYFVD